MVISKGVFPRMRPGSCVSSEEFLFGWFVVFILVKLFYWVRGIEHLNSSLLEVSCEGAFVV